jgi:hypothetical protein
LCHQARVYVTYKKKKKQEFMLLQEPVAENVDLNCIGKSMIQTLFSIFLNLIRARGEHNYCGLCIHYFAFCKEPRDEFIFKRVPLSK